MLARRSLFLAAGPVLSLLALLGARLAGFEWPACWTAAVTAGCATWWITEALPLPATSLIPFAAFPLLGVIDHRKVANAYGHHLILLLLGGFLFSRAIERSGAHRRLALGMVATFGRGGRRGVVFGFMVATAVCSMWISNSATVLMMLPVAQAVLAADRREDLRAPLLLGIAYAASIGGLGTPIGTPPNMTFMMVYEASTGSKVSFADWMVFGIPIVVLMIPVACWRLTRRVGAGGELQIPHPGPWRTAERRVLVVFIATALAWILRDIPAGGWTGWLGITTAGDETVAIVAVLAMFLIPDGDGHRLLDWETAADIPWGILLLFGGGLAIAMAFESSGLSKSLGDALTGLSRLPTPALVLGICLAVTFLTEITSNTATATLLMPILAAAAQSIGIDARLLMVPAAMSASCAFMLPVATAPNAIVFGTGAVPIRRMVVEGIWLNLVGAVIVTVVSIVALST